MHAAVAGEVGSAAGAAIAVQPAGGKDAEIGKRHSGSVVEIGGHEVEAVGFYPRLARIGVIIKVNQANVLSRQLIQYCLGNTGFETGLEEEMFADIVVFRPIRLRIITLKNDWLARAAFYDRPDPSHQGRRMIIPVGEAFGGRRPVEFGLDRNTFGLEVSLLQDIVVVRLGIAPQGELVG